MQDRQTTIMRRTIFLIVLIFSCSIVFGQARKVTGVVSDEKSELLPGVNVVLKGTTTGTITDANGTFSINVPKGTAILQFSFVGCELMEMDVAGMETVEIKLKQSTIGLEEIVTVGYGTQKKVNLSGSVESLKGENLAKRNTVMTSQALQGMAAGVTVTANNGKPGKEGTTVRIRGIGTINDNNPLVLIDGVSSSLDAIDPNDIESMSILKDAVSSAIYGFRAHN